MKRHPAPIRRRLAGALTLAHTAGHLVATGLAGLFWLLSAASALPGVAGMTLAHKALDWLLASPKD